MAISLDMTIGVGRTNCYEELSSLEGWAFDLSSLAKENLAKVETWEPGIRKLANAWRGAFFFSDPSDWDKAETDAGGFRIAGIFFDSDRLAGSAVEDLRGVLSFRLLTDSVVGDSIPDVVRVWAMGGVGEEQFARQWEIAKELGVSVLLTDRYPEELPTSWSFESVGSYSAMTRVLPPLRPATLGVEISRASAEAIVSTGIGPERFLGRLLCESWEGCKLRFGEISLVCNPQQLASRFLGNARIETPNAGLLSPRRGMLCNRFALATLGARGRFDRAKLRGQVGAVVELLNGESPSLPGNSELLARQAEETFFALVASLGACDRDSREGYSVIRSKVMCWFQAKSPGAKRDPALPARLESCFLSELLILVLNGEGFFCDDGGGEARSIRLWAHALLAATLTADYRIVAKVVDSSPLGAEGAFGGLFRLMDDLPGGSAMTIHFKRAITLGFLRYLQLRLTGRGERWCQQLAGSVRSLILVDEAYPRDYAAFCVGICGGLDALGPFGKGVKGVREPGAISFGVLGAFLYDWHAVVRVEEDEALAERVRVAIDLLADEFSSEFVSARTALFLVRLLAVSGRTEELKAVLVRAQGELGYEMSEFFDQATFFSVFGKGKMEASEADFGNQFSPDSPFSRRLQYLYVRLLVGDTRGADKVYPSILAALRSEACPMVRDELARAGTLSAGLALLFGFQAHADRFESLALRCSRTQSDYLRAMRSRCLESRQQGLDIWSGRLELLLSELELKLQG